jgi:hypothetical protein
MRCSHCVSAGYSAEEFSVIHVYIEVVHLGLGPPTPSTQNAHYINFACIKGAPMQLLDLAEL